MKTRLPIKFMALSLVFGAFLSAAWSQPPDDVPPADPGVTPAQAPAQPPAAQPTPPPPQGQPTATPTPTPTPVVYENVPVKTLWDQYQEAIRLIEAGNDSGFDALLRTFSSEDEKWARASTPLLIDLLSSGTIATSTVAEKKLFVAEALLRNMPRKISGQPKFYRPAGSAYGVAVVTDISTGKPVDYVTLLYQESGRWVLYHPFFIRPFIWMPQLAYYKKLRGMQNAPEEIEYLKNGFSSFTEWAQKYFTYCGYKPGEDTRGKPSTAPGAERR
ncbi:MAG: hypothetical protein N2Z21_01505 [Candidatus Sumerlaeaceae bacterium]|nr:hypothetical protein [Candidatus Sumerlaeaceae bacterium]